MQKCSFRLTVNHITITVKIIALHFSYHAVLFPTVFTLHEFHFFFMSLWAVYAISYLFVFCFTPPPALAALSDSQGSCKMKATALLHVTIPTLPFPFHWPQTPDFSEAKNRLLQTLTPPFLTTPSPLSLFFSRLDRL